MEYRATAFISYRRSWPDDEIARALRHGLVSNEVYVPAWQDCDSVEVRDDFDRKIEAGIDGAEYFIFVLSPRSAESDYCRMELARARRRQKVILPVLIEDTPNLPLQLELAEWCDFRRGVDKGLQDLLKRMRLSRIETAVPPDPLSRDELRIEGLAQACFHLSRGMGLEDYRSGLLSMLKTLGVACAETTRARDIVSALQTRNWNSLAQAGEWLRAAWHNLT